MKLPKPEFDYHNFHLRDINKKEYRHLWWLLFWPVYWLRYLLVEQLNPAAEYNLMHCALDDMIPFQEWFFIPYMLWMVVLIAMALYTMFYDIDAFKRYHKFMAICMTISTVIFLVYPSYQDLRPTEFPRDNFMSRLVGVIYSADTSTNVFPSEHVLGALGAMAAAVNTKSLRSPGKLIGMGVMTVLICLSTVFLKQHSVLDVTCSLVISLIVYPVCFRAGRKSKKAERISAAA